MPTKRVSFQTREGQRLAARLEVPTGRPPRAFALFAHCFTCTMNIKAAVRVSRALAREGIGVLRFDFAGLGESDGDFADTNFSSNVEDLLAARDYLEENHQAPAILIGHSLGGAAVLQAARHMPSVRAVATVGAPSDPAHVTDLLRESLDEIKSKGEARIQLAGRPIRLKQQFVEDLYAAKVEEAVRNLGKALLIFHSPVDTTVSIEHAARLFDMARHPKSFVSLDHADHVLSRAEDSEYVGTVLAAWARKYVDIAPADPHRGHDHRGHQVAVETGLSYTSEIWAQGHALVADEPESLGGNDAGPNPYGFVQSGLGACTAITVRMYANRKEWPLEGIAVSLDYRRVPKDELEEGDRRVDEMIQTVTLQGPLSEKQRQRLMQIAERCPVHRSLDAGVRIITQEG
jgi:uncharacterized OsmC-like protein/pimeloyl-ACP methyl ester carboxylesterase